MAPIRTAVLLNTVALIFVIAMSDAASSRPIGAAPRRSADPVPAAPVRGGPSSVILTELISDCERFAAELKNFPADTIALSIKLDGKQADALKNAQNVANETAEGVAETCPAAVPAEPLDRLDVLEREIGGIDGALTRMQPALIAFYGSLGDEQKARLVLKFAGLGSTTTSAQTTGSASQTLDAQTRPRSKMPGDDHNNGRSASTAQVRWNCEHWQAELRDWPPDRVGQTIIVDPRQRALLYELAAAVQHAADTLADSCPRNNSVTPIARIEDLKKTIDAVRKSFAVIRPALTALSNRLNDGQRSRFKDAI